MDSLDKAQVSRRISTRPMKRKELNDDFVALLPHGKKSSCSESLNSNLQDISLEVPMKKLSKSTQKRQRKLKASPTGISQMARWLPQDDLALITAVIQTSNLNSVHLGIRFSYEFTLKEIQERWYALLFDSVTSKLAMAAVRCLHPDVISDIQSQTLYSKTEEELLAKLPSTTEVSLNPFKHLLMEQSSVFYHTRTPLALQRHWLLMKEYNLLCDQIASSRNFNNTDDIEINDFLNDTELQDGPNEVLEHELALNDRASKREIRRLECDLQRFNVLIEAITGMPSDEPDIKTYAVLQGRLVRYLIRSSEVTIGRMTEDNKVDIDLALEGPSWRVSRRAATIVMNTSADFCIINEARRAVFVDGKPVLYSQKQHLNDGVVIEFANLKFVFSVNQKAIDVYRNNISSTPSNNSNT